MSIKPLFLMCGLLAAGTCLAAGQSTVPAPTVGAVAPAPVLQDSSQPPPPPPMSDYCRIHTC